MLNKKDKTQWQRRQRRGRTDPPQATIHLINMNGRTNALSSEYDEDRIKKNGKMLSGGEGYINRNKTCKYISCYNSSINDISNVLHSSIKKINLSTTVYL